MYEYIKGSVEVIAPTYVVIENGGIGFEIVTPNPFAYTKLKGQDTIIYTYQHVREDAIILFGFQSMEEKIMFKKLIGVSGIGPKGAMAILAFGEPAEVVRAIENEDEKFLTKFPGVGKKTARQMMLDLKGKLHDVVPEQATGLFAEHFDEENQSQQQKELEEALLALAALGYSDRELKKITAKLEKMEYDSADQYIKTGLQLLMK